MTKDVLHGVRYLRCFTEVPKKDSKKKPEHPRGSTHSVSPEAEAIRGIGFPWEHWVFVLDTETFESIGHSLRFGIYHVYGVEPSERMALLSRGELSREALDSYNRPYEKGIFYDPDALTLEEINTLKRFAYTLGYLVYDVRDFVKDAFYRWVYYRRALCVGHNLSFDLARLATEWKKGRGSFAGGFSLKLCGCKYERCVNHPPVRIKRIDRYKSFMDFQSINLKGKDYKGSFLDTATFGLALLGNDQIPSLEAMGKKFKARTRKKESPGHGETLTWEYLEYARQDVEATFALFQAQRDLYAKHGLSRPITEIYSEASLGKAYYKELGVRPFLKKNPDFPREVLGYGMTAYYGGRTEVRIRLKPTEVIYCDFKSQYPTVNALLGLQDLLLAESVGVRECTQVVRELLEELILDDLFRPATWKALRVLVKVIPRDDLLPLRTDYGTGKQTGDSYLTAEPTWYALPDLVASKIRTGKVPEILEAIELVPEGRQEGLKRIKLFGEERYTIDLDRDDLFTRFIDLRSEIKEEGKRAESDEEEEHLSGHQQALKLIANATSYGTLLEIKQSEPTVKGKEMTAWTNDGPIAARAPVLEEPGGYYFGPAGALIPAGGRLLLAMAEALAEREGIGYAFCDTDSMAFARPEEMGRRVFEEKVKRITDLFNSLSPYEGDAPILEYEDINFDQEGNLKPLHFIGVSAKRYVLYSREEDGSYTIRKFSSHGLEVWGDLEKKGYRSPDWIPEPQIKAEKMGGYKWIYDLWYQTIKAVDTESA